MLSLNQAKDLRDVLSDPEMKRSLECFVSKQRMDLVKRMVAALRAGDCDKAKFYAAQDEAYAELLSLLIHFTDMELSAA